MLKYIIVLIVVAWQAATASGQTLRAAVPQAPPIRAVCDCPTGCQCGYGGQCVNLSTCASRTAVTTRIIQAPPVRAELIWTSSAGVMTYRQEYIPGMGVVLVRSTTPTFSAPTVSNPYTTPTYSPQPSSSTSTIPPTSLQGSLPPGVWAEDGKLWKMQCADGRCRKVQYVP